MQSSGSSELVEEGDCIGYRKNLEFKPLTNFTFKFLYKVTTPSNLVDLSGFLVEVSQTIQDEQITGECFIPWHKSQMAGTSLTKELSPALPESATLGSKLSPSQIRELFWMKLEEFHNDPDVARNVKRAVSTLGRQLNSDVFVFGPHVQLDVDGNVTPLTEQQFIWVQKIVERFSVLPSTPIISTLPQCTNPMKFLVKGMRMLTQENFISGVLVLGAIMISLFHEDILRIFGNSGVAIAVGKVNRGKSKSVELSLAAVGCRGAKFTEISDALLRKLLLGAMPWCFDDPSDAEQLQRILIAAFGGANTGNMTSHGTARVAPIVTVNDFVLDDLASMDERYVCRASLIPFVHEVPYNLSKTAVINQIFDKAPAALPALVNLGHQLAQVDPKDLAVEMDHIQTVVPELDSRIVLGYTLTLCSAMIIASAVDDTLLCNDDIYSAFERDVVPVIKRYQVGQQKIPLGAYLVAFARSANSTSHILRVVNPSCNYTCDTSKKPVPGVAIILRELLAELDVMGIEHANESTLRKQLRKRVDCKTSTNQFFLKKDCSSAIIDRTAPHLTRNASCVIIPRKEVPAVFFDIVDNKGPEDLGIFLGSVDTTESGGTEAGATGDADGYEDDGTFEGEEGATGDDDGPEEGEEGATGDADGLSVAGGVEDGGTIGVADNLSFDGSMEEGSTGTADNLSLHGGMEEGSTEDADSVHLDGSMDDDPKRFESSSSLSLRNRKVISSAYPKPLSRSARKLLAKLSPTQHHRASPFRNHSGLCGQHASCSSTSSPSPAKRQLFLTKIALPQEFPTHPISPKAKGSKKAVRSGKRKKGQGKKGFHQSTCVLKECSHPRARSWVQCEQCDRWWHCMCAGVTLSTAKKSAYNCTSCLT